ncbi:MAG: hypothetical protein ACTSQA_00445 [Candidatus Heimdallarchaeaceae archaeon]
MANQVPNTWKGQLWKPFLTDVYKMILMQSGFVFNKDEHHSYADVSSSELATGNGYTAGGVTLTGIVRTVDDVGDKCSIAWNNVTINATGGSLTASGAIIYNDTADGTGIYDYAKIIVSYKDAGGNITAVDGTPIVISAVSETVEDKV